MQLKFLSNFSLWPSTHFY
uniref:Uncharacterized protein n=1 Tax=Rhizophora mucronata TaxID=61149 RepID=A0A2P2MT10_RHIMU